MGWSIYILAAALLVLGAMLRRGGRNSSKMRDNSGNVVVGDVNGSLEQRQSGSPAPAKGGADKVSWFLQIIGIVIAAAALAYDILKA